MFGLSLFRLSRQSNISTSGEERFKYPLPWENKIVKCPTPGPTKTIKSPPTALPPPPHRLYMDRCISVCLLKILWSGWFFGKHLSTMCRNFLPRLVLTFELKGGLYHVMFLVRFLLFFRAFSCGGLYVNLWSYPLSVRAFW